MSSTAVECRPSTDVAGWDVAIMADTNGKRQFGPDRLYDRLRLGVDRQGDLPAIVGLFEGSRCRRCETGFTEDAQRDHQAWHEWCDQNTAV